MDDGKLMNSILTRIRSPAGPLAGPLVRLRPGLCLCLCLCLGSSARAMPRWPDERRVGLLVCHADFSLTPYIGLFHEVASLEQEIMRHLKITPAEETIHLYLFAKQSAYRRYLRKYFPDVPYRRALFVKGRGSGMVLAFASREFPVDLKHECTHALLHASLPMVPLWLDEGLAEYFEIPAEARELSHPYLDSFKWNLRLGTVASIAELEGVSSLDQMGRGHYRNAWAWVHFMLHGPPEAHDELVRFLQDIRTHQPPGQLSHRLRQRIPNLNQRFQEHWRNVH